MVLRRGADGTLNPALSLAGITRRFGAVVALDEASLVVRPATVHALLGENGAGKTTLMRLAFGMLGADSGTMVRNGAPLQVRSPAEAIRAGIGMVHQHYSLVPAMTVAENLVLGGGALPGWRFDRRAAEARVATLAASAGLPIDPAARVESLPVSAQQRLEILKALARDATLLILDEPTAVLAPAESEELMRWLRRYVAAGNAAVLITHKLREALDVADDVTVLRSGRTVLRSAAKALQVDDVAAAMLGDGSARDARVPGAGIVNGIGDIVAELQDVSAHMPGERSRLSGVTLAVRAGEVVGVVGVEGAGQHALMRVLAGRLSPERGDATLPPEIAFIPEDRHRDALALDLSLAENVALRGAGARRGTMRWREWHARTLQLLAAHDVRASGSRAPGRALSGGNQQKLVVARELDGAPGLVVAENPTRGLDVRATAAVHASLREAARAGAGVVVYSSDLDEVLELATRVVAVHEGRVREVEATRDTAGRAMLGSAP